MKKVLAIALALAAGNAFAAMGSVGFQVRATVVPTCDIVVGDMLFGNYDVVTGAVSDQTSTITLHCTKGATPRVALSNGAAGGVNPRHMTGTAPNLDVLTYNLFTDSNRTIVWDTTPVAAASSAVNKGTALTMTIYGRILANQDVSADSYVDNITATVSF